MRKQHSGFTLIEIAIVLVIIGLLLGGVLKGQELITAARVRNLISTQDGVKAAYFGFLDRYRALPGDYTAANANANIPGCGSSCFGGDANGQIVGAESIHAWEHMSRAGFVTGSYISGSATPTAGATNTPTNPYGSLKELVFDANYQDVGTASNRHNLKTGANIPSDILAEVDRKVDDGSAAGGQVRFSAFGGADTTAGACFNATSFVWQSATPNANCGATNLF